jgi:tetratricopeptide (TPR) repeat protein
MTGRYATFTAAGILILAAAGCARHDADADAGLAVRLRAEQAVSTSRDALTRTIAEGRAQLMRDPDDAGTAVTLADALLRHTRVTGHAGLSVEAGDVLRGVLRDDPDSYEARRMLGSVYLSLHRFRDALREATACLTVRPDDAFVLGVLGDAHLELGEYDQAFAAFDRMNQAKPTAASYARASYARELQGDLVEATRFMQMALEATAPQDSESVAWHRAQIGHLYLIRGRLDEARREFAHAEFVFAGHPFASAGLARVAAASGDLRGALTILERRLSENPLPDDFALAGDVFAALGQPDAAERHYRLAEAAWRSDVPEPARLARFMAERHRRLDEALDLAEATFAERRDIYTADALAWTLFQQGQVDRAEVVMAEALRTGTADRVTLYHAAAIAHAKGDITRARTLARRAVTDAPGFDLIAGPAAARLIETTGPARSAAR